MGSGSLIKENKRETYLSPFFAYVLSTTNKQFSPNSFPIRYFNGSLIVANAQ